ITLSFDVTVTDSANATDTEKVTITITGTNDVPEDSSDARSVTEDVGVTSEGKLTVDGAITITDTDAGESHFNTGTLQFVSSTSFSGTQLGSINLNQNGAYTYTVDNSAVQYLKAGETIVETYTVKSADGTQSSTITIT